MQREKSQQTLKAPNPSGHAKASTSWAHASPHVTPSSSSRRRHAYEYVPPHTTDAADSVPPLEGEAAANAKLDPFGGGPVDLSLLPLYPYDTTRHIWDTKQRNPHKFINHMRKITDLPQPNGDWFQTVLSLSGLKDLCMTGYTTIIHMILNAFMERWHSGTSSFHLPFGEMSITIDDVLCLLHLSIRGRLLDHWRITKDEALMMMVDYLGANPREANEELDKTRGAHARFEYLKQIYTDEIHRSHQATGDDEQVGLHGAYALRVYMLYLIDTTIFMDKSATCINIVYLRYFMGFEWNHEYN
ncbi:protein MAIN-LIKE 1-like [Lathyrus oleraceus]|uniref:protein MAIN-LIKE 1-like n=1 Tax=Pisum sativum TaxID=3888 RepID=UPI0021D25F99|nr:protein MAIN-LIKE 1-like [Pisum sativum]